jgi:hypothetical protein
VHAWTVATKHPRRLGMCCSLVVVIARGQRANGFIQRRREVDRRPSQIDGHGVSADGDLFPGDGGDVFGALGEDDHQDRSQPIAGMKCLLVGDFLDDGVLLVDRHARGGSAAVRRHLQIRRDELGLDGPPDEPQDVLTGARAVGLPQIDVSLGEVLDGDAVLGGQPIAELDRHG